MLYFNSGNPSDYEDDNRDCMKNRRSNDKMEREKIIWAYLGVSSSLPSLSFQPTSFRHITPLLGFYQLVN